MTAMQWLRHIVFDPLSEWEKLKITLVLLPLWMALFFASAMWCRKRK